MATVSNPITSNPSPAPAPSTSSSSTPNVHGADEQTFLLLLVAQLKNQDPTNPVDGTQFVAQLAQFSQLEQMINANTKLQQIHQDLTPNGQTPSNPATGTPSIP
jgi:flagellar basal-body rod modification protein FlgD